MLSDLDLGHAMYPLFPVINTTWTAANLDGSLVSLCSHSLQTAFFMSTKEGVAHVEVAANISTLLALVVSTRHSAKSPVNATAMANLTSVFCTK